MVRHATQQSDPSPMKPTNTFNTFTTQEEVEGYLSISKDGVNIKQLNAKLRSNKKKNSASKKRDRFLLSPPKKDGQQE